MENRLTAQQITESSFENLESDDIEILFEDIDYAELEFLDLQLLEMEKSAYKNVRARLILDLIQDSSQVFNHSYPPRTRHEINGG